MQQWAPDSWRALPAEQQPDWPDAAALDDALATLREVPPLVFAGEARNLTEALAAVTERRGFVLQAGDCAESFDAFSANAIRDKLQGHPADGRRAHLRQRRSHGEDRAHRRAVRQAALRSHRDARRRRAALVPRRHGQRLRVRSRGPSSRSRNGCVQAYHQAASTLNLLRAFAKGGFADLSRVHAWNLEYVDASPEGRRYDALAAEIDRALRFMAACGIDLNAGAPAPRGRLLHVARGAAPRLRGGAHPARQPHRPTGTTARPTSCGSASAPASSAARTSSS